MTEILLTGSLSLNSIIFFCLSNIGGVSALRHGVEQEQYKIVGELIKLGADTVNLSLSPGDTPIHATMTIVLEKGKGKRLK